MPLSASRVLRVFRYAMYFDGVDDSVLIPNTATTSTILKPLNGTSEVCVLIPGDYRIPSFSADPFRSGRFGWTTARMDPDNTFRNHVYDGAWRDIAKVAFSRNAWYCTATTWVSGGSASWYMNGVKMGTVGIGTIQYDSLSITIGYDPWGAYVKVYIYIVKIYSRALSDSEVLWNYIYPDNPVRNGLVLWLQADPNNVKDIDGDGILEWLDLSGYNNHGKIYGATLVQLIKPSRRLLPPARVLNVRR